MFSGIIEGKAKVIAWNQGSGLSRLTIEAPVDVSDVRIGDSISLAGVCLTVVEIQNNKLSFELAPETIRKSKFQFLKLDDYINFERSLKLGDRIHGHIVSGHVDAVGKVVSVNNDGETVCLTIAYPKTLNGLFAQKGSVAIDGVSLTVGDVFETEFSVYIIPHTLEVTTLGSLKPDSSVNLEVDMLARYVNSLLKAQ